MPYTKEEVDSVINKINNSIDFYKSEDEDFLFVSFSISELKVIFSLIKNNEQ